MQAMLYLTATLLGGLHAIEPGHGKSAVAAYLIGTKGQRIDAALFGLVATFAHTFSVFLLAIIAKLASGRMLLGEESLHGYLGLLAGLFIVTVGVWMLVVRIRNNVFSGLHSHNHGDGYSGSRKNARYQHGFRGQGGRGRSHEPGNKLDNHERKKRKRLNYWQLVLLGVSGGLIPCPAAIAILFAALALGGLGEGLTYILLFSLGLGAVLIAIGLTVVGASRLAGLFLDTGRLAGKVSVASAAIITLLGVFTVLSSAGHFFN